MSHDHPTATNYAGPLPEEIRPPRVTRTNPVPRPPSDWLQATTEPVDGLPEFVVIEDDGEPLPPQPEDRPLRGPRSRPHLPYGQGWRKSPDAKPAPASPPALDRQSGGVQGRRPLGQGSLAGLPAEQPLPQNADGEWPAASPRGDGGDHGPCRHRRRPISTLDLTGIFAGECGRVVRRFALASDGAVTISDRLEGLSAGDSVTWQMMTRAAVTLRGDDGAVLAQDGKTLSVTFSCRGGTGRIAAQPAVGAHDFDAPNPGATLLTLTVTATAATVAIDSVLARPEPR